MPSVVLGTESICSKCVMLLYRVTTTRNISALARKGPCLSSCAGEISNSAPFHSSGAPVWMINYMVTLPADGWPVGPRNSDFRGITRPQGRSSLITGKSGLCQEHLTRELRATVGMFPEAESRV